MFIIRRGLIGILLLLENKLHKQGMDRGNPSKINMSPERRYSEEVNCRLRQSSPSEKLNNILYLKVTIRQEPQRAVLYHEFLD